MPVWGGNILNVDHGRGWWSISSRSAYTHCLDLGEVVSGTTVQYCGALAKALLGCWYLTLIAGELLGVPFMTLALFGEKLLLPSQYGLRFQHRDFISFTLF